MGQIEKELVLVGSLNKFEIWNPKVYKKYNGEDEQSLSDLAEDLSLKDAFFDRGD